MLLKRGWPDGVLLNLNFPDCGPAEVKGIAFTKQIMGLQPPRIDERGCNVIGESLVRGEVARTLPGNYGGDFFVGNAALLGKHNVSIDFIGSSEFGTGDKDGHFSNGFRQ